MPIDPKKLAQASVLMPKLSRKLYGPYAGDVKQATRREISRGLATASAYSDIARNVNNVVRVGFNKTMRIARTEGHRIQVLSAYDAQLAAKDAGADVVKQWDATLDGHTRDVHMELNGQIRELEEPFEAGGYSPMYPSDFGDPAEDINCRCALTQRARWALDDDETQMLQDADSMDDDRKKMLADKLGITPAELEKYSGQTIPIKAKNYADFRRQYNKTWNYEKVEALRNRAATKAKATTKIKEAVKPKDYKALTLEEFKTMKHSITKAERKIIHGTGHLEGYVNSSNAKKINKILRSKTGRVSLSDKEAQITDVLQGVINKNTLNSDIITYRYVERDALFNLAGVEIPKASLKQTAKEFFELLDEVPSNIKIGHVYTERGFLSTSGVATKNVMRDRQVFLKIRAPKGTNCYVTNNNKETEIIFGQNTKLKIINATVENSGTSDWKVVLECEIE